jgi:RNA polymerase sigma factor for flagellar operon FliA
MEWRHGSVGPTGLVGCSWGNAVETLESTYRQIAVQSRRDQLILEHLSLVRHVVGRLLAELPPGLDVENLQSAATLGLVEAAGKFDPTRGVEFKTYACTRIRGAALDELRRNCPLPQEIVQRVVKVRNAYRELRAPVSVEQLADVTGLAYDEVVDCLAAMRMTRMVSWEESRQTHIVRLDDAHERPHSALERAEEKQILADAIAGLPERERKVVTLYYLEDLRLKEIGQVLNLSESRISRLLSSALFQLGERLRAQESK